MSNTRAKTNRETDVCMDGLMNLCVYTRVAKHLRIHPFICLSILSPKTKEWMGGTQFGPRAHDGAPAGMGVREVLFSVFDARCEGSWFSSDSVRTTPQN